MMSLKSEAAVLLWMFSGAQREIFGEVLRNQSTSIKNVVKNTRKGPAGKILEFFS